MAEDRVERRLAAIFAADVIGYARLVRANEEDALAAVGALISDVIQPAVAEHRGRIFKEMGDAVLAEFGSTVDAVRCAIAVQREIADRGADTAPEQRIAFRIGLHVGDVVVDGDDIQGDGVNVASRIEGLATANGICISEDVFRQVEGRIEAGFEDIGPQRLKNIDSPIRVYRVRPDAARQGRVVTALATRLRRLKWPAVALAAFVIALAGVFLIPDPPPPPGPAQVPSIAVLPFENLSGGSEQDFLSDGLTESIISSLSKISEMLVIDRNSTGIYKGKQVTPQTVAEEQSVRYVLAGSVQRSGDQLRVTAQLIDAIKGQQLWSERYDRSLTDLFAVQDEITREIMIELQVKLTAGEVARVRAGSTNLKAWKFFVRGLTQFERFTKADNANARTLAQQAAEQDPKFAAAWMLLGWTHLIDARFRWSASRDEALRMAGTVTEKAMALSPEDAEIHALMASIHLYQGDYDEAVASGQRAVELGPNIGAVTATVATITSAVGDWEQTIELIKSATRANPRIPSWYLLYLSRAYAFSGDPQMAISTAEQGLARAESGYLRGGFHLVLAWVHVEVGQMGTAREQMAEALDLTPGLTMQRWRKGYLYRDPANLDRIADALKQAGLPE